ncbi:hypothetical protein [Pandoraea sputorum]|uniref:Uncharacterized protein n=1 Tax=Pandoraea sputorum TaxID=93222 RepID=A0A239SIW0_9BURK|nr:hypothetical protein [Pandoraea sputorum]SNU85337.1 Uncharacterised protein [Pandoraea sputorum]VVD84895.1 hypothetical protein PSP20601_01307 [Pandoraea sputorum]
MSSLHQRYKGFEIEAQAKLVGPGGFSVPSNERRYVPIAVLRGVSVGDTDDPGERNEAVASEGVVIHIRLSNCLDTDPYRAIQVAVAHAHRVIDAMAGTDFDIALMAPIPIPLPRVLH